MAVMFLKPLPRLQYCRITTAEINNRSLHPVKGLSTAILPKTQCDAHSISREDIRTHCLRGRLKEAMNILDSTHSTVDSSTYVSLLQGCIHKKSLPGGKRIHAHISERSFLQNILVQNTLLNMYIKCGSVDDARRVFDQIPKRDVCSWTIMIAGHARHGSPEEALVLYHRMQETGVQANQFTFASVLPACTHLAALEQGVEIHKQITRCGFQSDMVVVSALVDMYAKCGSLETARDLFDKIYKPDVVSWTAIIAGYARCGPAQEALSLFHQMQRTGVKPNQLTFASVLAACANLGSLEEGFTIHSETLRRGIESDIIVLNALVDMYAKCGSVENARDLFAKIPRPDIVSWTVMVAAYARHGPAGEALALFHRMQQIGLKPNEFTFSSVLSACANLASLEQGVEIHEEIIKCGFQCDVVVMNALVDMYAKCGSIKKAREIFDKMRQRDVVSWNTMITGCAQSGFVDDALELFGKMPKRNAFSWTAIIAGLAQNGLVDDAAKLFKEMPCQDLVSCNVMITGYVQKGFVDEALEIFQKMPQRDIFSWTAMIAGFAQNGHVDEALNLFKEMPQQALVSWNAIIGGFVQSGHYDEALKLFQQMQMAGVRQDATTFSSILPVCSNFAALEQGMEIHENIIRSGFQSDVFLTNALIDMYSKCGSIQKAHEIFDKMNRRDVVSWTTMISGYAMHGRGKETLKLFEEMKQSGISPDHVTLVHVLSACSHAGLLDEGYQYFNCMSEYYHITPTIEHYSCMVDLLGRAGHLDEAQNFIENMPIKPNTTVWIRLLAACRMHNNAELGECVAERIFELDSRDPAAYVLLSNIYAAAGRQDDIEKLRKLMKDRGLKKIPGCSWIEINKQVHAFVIGDRSYS